MAVQAADAFGAGFGDDGALGGGERGIGAVEGAAGEGGDTVVLGEQVLQAGAEVAVAVAVAVDDEGCATTNSNAPWAGSASAGCRRHPKLLEREGVVDRNLVRSIPSHVEYSLTPTGEAVVDSLGGLLSTIIEFTPRVAAARQRYDRKHAQTQDRPAQDA
ncbi:winged helix-turn-helix transcriptional regulator [Nocardia tengchongensis]|uniref:winged helix-turn-helix transcriptional regulator n=1 Tax=Nocardia tengchongensis TaxID=2055889 RepID=UPI0036842CB7